jgi:hypothetical protein
MSDELLALDLESRLTIAHRRQCECAPYFIARRRVLIPEVLNAAKGRGIDPVDLFAQYARGVHARHEAGLSLDVEAAS